MTNAEMAILSLVAEQARHGYEIEQVIEARGMREWTEVGFSSIYYLLNKLEKKGLIEAHLEQSSGPGPARKVYQATAVGRQGLREAVLEALSAPQRCYLPIQLGLANLPSLAPAEALAALRQYQDRLAEGLEQLRARQESQRPLPYFVEAMFEHSLALIQAELMWIKQFIKQLEEQHG